MNEPISLVVHHFNNRSWVSAAELFDIIYPYSKAHYSRWVKINITHQPQELPTKGIDFIGFEEAKVKKPIRIKGGKKRVDYLLSVSFSIQLCYQTKTLPSKEVNSFLYKIKD